MALRRFSWLARSERSAVTRVIAWVGQVVMHAGPCGLKLHKSHFTATARMPGTQSRNGLTARGARGAASAFEVLQSRGISTGVLPEKVMAPNGQAKPHSLQLTHRLSLRRLALFSRVMALTGHTCAQGASSHW